jgi:hypothetical protein
MSARKFGFNESLRCKRRIQFDTNAYMVSVLPGRESSSVCSEDVCPEAIGTEWPARMLRFGPQLKPV